MPPTVSWSRPVEKFLTTLLYCCTSAILAVAWFPAGVWAGWVTSAARAWLYLGYWPCYHHPSPQTLPAELGPLTEVLETAAMVVVIALLVWLTIVCFRRLVPKRWWLTAAAILWPLAWLALYVLARSDPGGVLDWAFS
jgi:hypothetical protein